MAQNQQTTNSIKATPAPPISAVILDAAPDEQTPPAVSKPAPSPSNPAAVLDFASMSDAEQTAFIERLERLDKFKASQVKQHEESERIEMARQQIENFRQAQREVEISQANCAHLKEDGRRLNVVGQKDHSANPVLICQRCQKVWNYAKGDSLPVHLQNMYDSSNMGVIH